MQNKIFIVVFLFSVLLSSSSQVILKKSAKKTYNNTLKEYFNFYVIFAYGMFFLSSLLTVISYRNIPLSLGAALEATGYIWVPIFSFFCIKESISGKKLFGIALILIGIMIFNC